MGNQLNELDFYEEAVDDYKKLDGSQKKFVLKALKRIEESKGEIGEYLGRQQSIDLTGFKRVSLSRIGIRIVFKVEEEKVVVATIVAIGMREDKRIYKEALRRLLKKNEKI